MPVEDEFIDLVGPANPVCVTFDFALILQAMEETAGLEDDGNRGSAILGEVGFEFS